MTRLPRTDPRTDLLSEVRAAVAITRLIETGDQLLERGVTPEYRDAHTRACQLFDECEDAGIPEWELDRIIAEGAR